MALPGQDGLFPLWLSYEARRKIQETGRCQWPFPAMWIGRDSLDAYHGLMWIELRKGEYVFAKASVARQRFPVIELELLGEVLVFELVQQMERALAGRVATYPRSVITSLIERYEARYELATVSTVTLHGASGC